MASRRNFSDEYKREAVRLATQPGVTKRQVGRELGSNANLLGRWCVNIFRPMVRRRFPARASHAMRRWHRSSGNWPG